MAEPSPCRGPHHVPRYPVPLSMRGHGIYVPDDLDYPSNEQLIDNNEGQLLHLLERSTQGDIRVDVSTFNGCLAFDAFIDCLDEQESIFIY